MGHQGKHNLAYLEARIKEFSAQLTTMTDTQDLEEMISIIHKPGWTTPTEYLLVSGIVDALSEHAKVLASLRQILINGATLSNSILSCFLLAKGSSAT